ncbi:MAG TPA: high-potential iron-sulfur protein [Polyangiaceae bacterium]|nr:high-potential iron-sulfur protein [Polyangiaceae bacterium]
MDSKISRRDVLGRGAALGILTVIGSTAACSKEQKALKCTDTTALSTADLQARTALQYMDTSVEPGKNCTGCQQFIPAAPDACGTCKVVKGPINPKGYCKSFVAKPA